MADPEMPVVGMEHLEPYPTSHIEHSPLEQPAEVMEQEHLTTCTDTPQMDAGGLEEDPQPQKQLSTEQMQLSPDDVITGGVSIRSGAVPGTDTELEHLEEDLDTTGSKPVHVKPKMASLRLQTRGGRMRADQDRIKSLLKEAIINMCNTGLYYQTEMRIEGLLGVTLDRREVILVNVHDIIRTSESEDDFTTKIPFTPTVHKRKMSRPWRVTGRSYVKRAARRAATTNNQDDGPIMKKRRKLDDNPEEDKVDMDLFANTSFNHAQNNPDSQEGDSSLSSANITHLAQAVSWYASVDEEARMGEAPLLNDHGLPLPDPLTSPEKADMICMINEQVARGFVKKQEKKKRRGEYNNYTAEMRAKIGQFAVEQGIGKAMKHFKSLFGRPISESTVRCMRKAYLDAKMETQADEVVVLPKKDRGRPLMLKEYDTDVMEYIENLRRNGAQINVQIVMDAARGVLLHKDKTRLKEFGGTIEITKAWAQSFMARKGLHGLGRRRRKSEGPKTPKKKKGETKVEEGSQDQQQQQQHQSQHQPPMQHHQIPQQHHPGAPHQQQQQQLPQQQQQQQQAHHSQQQSLSQHPTPVHTPHPQDHEAHLHNLDVCTPPPAHESRNNTMVFPERQLHAGEHSTAMHDHHRNAMVFDRQHHPHPTEHGPPPPMHDHTGRMIFPDRHPMAGSSTPSMQDPHHMFFPERLNLNPVPPAHCSLWPSQNIHHKNN